MAKFHSLRDIASRAGVSSAAVSYVLNGRKDKVSTETAARIMAIVKELNYQPNMAARSLSMGKSQLIGLILPITVAAEKFIGLIGENPFYGEFFDGVESQLRIHGYDVILAGFHPSEDCSDWVRRRGLDGVIFLGSYPRDMLEKLEQEGVAVVLTDTEPELQSAFFNVGVDDELGAWMATEHLIRLGHKKIALAGGDPTNSYVNSCRQKGYLRALEEAGLDADPRLRFVNNVSLGGGRRIAAELMKSPIKPDAVFAMADTMALGILGEYLSHGLRVPQELSIVGFDDLAIFRAVPPGLTTIRQDVVGKGSASAQMILRRLEGEEISSKRLELPLSLIERGTAAASLLDS